MTLASPRPSPERAVVAFTSATLPFPCGHGAVPVVSGVGRRNPAASRCMPAGRGGRLPAATEPVRAVVCQVVPDGSGILHRQPRQAHRQPAGVEELYEVALIRRPLLPPPPYTWLMRSSSTAEPTGSPVPATPGSGAAWRGPPTASAEATRAVNRIGQGKRRGGAGERDVGGTCTTSWIWVQRPLGSRFGAVGRASPRMAPDLCRGLQRTGFGRRSARG